MSHNPPWASKIYSGVCAEIRAKAQAHGLPLPLEEQGEECQIGPDYGEGHYGVVYPTTDPGVVFKITTDETEAHFVSLWDGLRARGINPSGIVRYMGIFGVESMHRGRPVFVLWREAAAHVGEVDDVFCGGPAQQWVVPDPYLCRQYNFFERQLLAWQSFCGVARRTYLGNKKVMGSDKFWSWVGEQVQAVEQARVWELGDELLETYLKETQDPNIRSYIIFDTLRARLARHPNKFAVLVHIASRIAEEMTNENVAYQVGRAFSEYLEAGILMADVHPGNLGFVAKRPGDNDFALWMPVITDPGHVLILKRELSEARIERL